MNTAALRLVAPIAVAALAALTTFPGAVAAPRAPPSNAAWLKAHARETGVVTLPGPQYRVLASGPASGAHPSRKDDVVVRYSGRLLDGKEFDSSAKSPGGTATFPLGRLIPGWVAVVQLMRPGDRWEIVLPPELAYGARGAGEVIPPDAVLIFEVELVSSSPHVEPPTPAH